MQKLFNKNLKSHITLSLFISKQIIKEKLKMITIISSSVHIEQHSLNTEL